MSRNSKPTGQRTAQKQRSLHLLERFLFWSSEKSMRSPIVYRALRVVFIVDAPAAACQQPLLMRAKAVGRMVTSQRERHASHTLNLRTKRL
jgi:hypothetical protein